MLTSGANAPSTDVLKQSLNFCVHKNSYVNIYSGFSLLENINHPNNSQPTNGSIHRYGTYMERAK